MSDVIYHDFSSSRYISFDTETKDPNLVALGPGTFRGDGFIIGFSLADESGFHEYYNVNHPDCTAAERKRNFEYLRDVMALPVPKVGVNTQYDVDWITNGHGIPVNGDILDCAIAEALLDENLPSFSLDNMAVKYLNKHKAKGIPERICEENGWKGDFRQHLWRMNYADVREYGKADALYPIKILLTQLKLLDAQELMPVFELEGKITKILIEMRKIGVRLDQKKREENSAALRSALEERKRFLEKHYGSFNYNSSKQVARVLDALGAQYKRKESTGNPILDAHALKRLANDYPVCTNIIEIKKIDKILNSFLDKAFVENVAPDGRLHSIFYNTKTESEGGLAGTRSGRFSCIAAGALVTTKRGYVPIEQILPGDYVLTHRGNWAQVQALQDNGLRDTVQLTTDTGDVLSCTPDHLLYTKQGWLRADTAREVLHVSMQKTFMGRCAAKESDSTIYERCHKDSKTGWGGIRGWLRYSARNAQDGALQRGESGTAREASLTREDREVKSNAWAHRYYTSKLEGRLQQWFRPPHDGCRRRALFHTPHCNSETTTNTSCTTTRRADSPPYKRESDGQRRRQFSCYDKGWPYALAQQIAQIVCRARGASQDSSATVATYRTITTRTGSPQIVYDIVLDHPDHSFIANGFAVHNCAKMNLQQIPSYDAKEKDDFKRWYTRLCRELFLPEENHDWLKIDYSQIEYRFMAHFACNAGPNDTSADDVRQAYIDKPDTDYHEMIQELTGLPRKLAKNLNFGVGYGMGKAHMSEFFGWDPDYCDEVLSTYHSRAPFVKATMNAVSAKARAQGFIRTFLKRRSRLTDPNKAYIMFCRLCQGSAADLTKQAMVNAWEAGIFDVLPLHLTVHDEIDCSMPRTPIGVEAAAELKNIMEKALVLRVPIIAEAEIGPNWVDLVGFDPDTLKKQYSKRRR